VSEAADDQILCPVCPDSAPIRVHLATATMQAGQCYRCNSVILGRRTPHQRWVDAQLEYTRPDGVKGLVRGGPDTPERSSPVTRY
jgi:hypothetical protein